MAHVLDDDAFLTRLDPKGMLRLTVEFPQQCRRAIAIAQQSGLPPLDKPSAVIVTGLGGSASGGDIVRALNDETGAVPVVVNRDYTLPVWVDGSCLVVAASYSGNTEETLSAYDDAVRHRARRVAVTSGGELARRAEAAGDPVIRIPGGQPPRTALGYLLFPLLHVATHAGVVPPQDLGHAVGTLDRAVERYGPATPFDSNPAKQLAERLHESMIVVYGLGNWPSAVAGRWRAQLNENSKNLAISHAFPELNHNEILGWMAADRQAKAYAVVYLRSGNERKELTRRAEVTKDLASSVWRSLTWVEPELGPTFSQMLELCLMGDFVSIYLAALNGVDPENIDWINHLKAEMAALQAQNP